MRLRELHFFEGRNPLAAVSGARCRFAGLDPRERVDPQRLLAALEPLPVVLDLDPAALQGPIAAVAEPVLLALTTGHRLLPAPSRPLGQGHDHFTLWLPIDDHRSAELAATLLCALFEAVRSGAPARESHRRIWDRLQRTRWSFAHAHLARAARTLDIPFDRDERLGEQVLRLGQGCRARLFRQTLTDRTPHFACAAGGRLALRSLLEGHGFPLPVRRRVTTLAVALTAAEELGWPVALSGDEEGGRGEGLPEALTDAAELERAWRGMEGDGVPSRLLERRPSGHEHRLLVSQGQLLAVALLIPAELVSDGRRTLAEQIAAWNLDPRRGHGEERPLRRVPLGEELIERLALQGLDLEAVPPAGAVVRLAPGPGIELGGTASDLSGLIHPENRSLAEDAARLIGSDILELHLVSRDLSIPWRRGGTWIVGADTGADLLPHLVAAPGSDLCRRLVALWMGSAQHSRIPTALITGSVGKTTTSRLLAHLLGGEDRRVGLSCSTGTSLGEQVLRRVDASWGGELRQLLRDPRTDAAVGEIARGGLLKYGLAVADGEVCAVLNVLDNHLGIDGIESREQLARIKGIVAAAFRRLLVLHADDPLVLAMAEGVDPARVALVSLQEENPRWWAHRRAGNLVVACRTGPGGGIRLYRGDHELLALESREIPAAEQGAVRAVVVAAAFAAPMGLALGMAAERLLDRFRTYGLEPSHRFGRFQRVRERPCPITLVWADGPEAVAALSEYVTSQEQAVGARKVLCFSAPDNRPDDYLRRMGEACGGFDLVLCCSWNRRRGRESQEVPRLLAEGVRRAARSTPGPGAPNPSVPQVIEAGTEAEAVASLPALVGPGDFCLISCFETLWILGALERIFPQPPSGAAPADPKPGRA